MEKLMMVGSSSTMQSSSRSCEELSEDVLLQIFLLLPLESIFKFKLVSKRWLSLLSSPLFKSSLFNSRFNPPIPWAFLYNLKCSANKSVAIASPDPQAQFISAHDGFSFRFLYSEISPSNEQLYLLGSSNGLVLCSTKTAFQKKYYVCNPLTKKWVSLPRPPTNKAWVLNGFICESSSPTRTVYKVVRILECCHPPFTSFTIEIFSSNSGEWNTYKVSCQQEITMRYPFLSNVVTRNGVLYWIEGQNRIIAYDLNNNNNENGGRQCRLVDLPVRKNVVRYDYQCLGESEGFISYCHCKNGELSVWALEEDYFDEGWAWRALEEDYFNEGWIWRLVNKIKVEDMLAEKCDFPVLEKILKLALSKMLNLKPLAFNPVDPNVVVLVLPRRNDCCFAYNFRTRKLEMLSFQSLTYHYKAGEVFPFVLTPKSTNLPAPSWSDC